MWYWVIYLFKSHYWVQKNKMARMGGRCTFINYFDGVLFLFFLLFALLTSVILAFLIYSTLSSPYFVFIWTTEGFLLLFVLIVVKTNVVTNIRCLNLSSRKKWRNQPLCTKNKVFFFFGRIYTNLWCLKHNVGLYNQVCNYRMYIYFLLFLAVSDMTVK